MGSACRKSADVVPTTNAVSRNEHVVHVSEAAVPPRQKCDEDISSDHTFNFSSKRPLQEVKPESSDLQHSVLIAGKGGATIVGSAHCLASRDASLRLISPNAPLSPHGLPDGKTPLVHEDLEPDARGLVVIRATAPSPNTLISSEAALATPIPLGPSSSWLARGDGPSVLTGHRASDSCGEEMECGCVDRRESRDTIQGPGSASHAHHLPASSSRRAEAGKGQGATSVRFDKAARMMDGFVVPENLPEDLEAVSAEVRHDHIHPGARDARKDAATDGVGARREGAGDAGGGGDEGAQDQVANGVSCRSFATNFSHFRPVSVAPTDLEREPATELDDVHSYDHPFMERFLDDAVALMNPAEELLCQTLLRAMPPNLTSGKKSHRPPH